MHIHSAKELAAYIVDQRKKLKLSQAQVADRVGFNQKTISAFENKPENIKVGTLFRILSAINFELEVIKKDKIKTSKIGWSEEW